MKNAAAAVLPIRVVWMAVRSGILKERMWLDCKLNTKRFDGVFVFGIVVSGLEKS